MRLVACSTCDGARLKPSTLAVTIEGKNISEVSDMSIGESAKFLAALEREVDFWQRQLQGAPQVLALPCR